MITDRLPGHAKNKTEITVAEQCAIMIKMAVCANLTSFCKAGYECAEITERCIDCVKTMCSL